MPPDAPPDAWIQGGHGALCVSSPRTYGIPKNSLEIPWNSEEFIGILRNSQELLGIECEFIRILKQFSGIRRNSNEFIGIIQNSEEVPIIITNYQELDRITKTGQDFIRNCQERGVPRMAKLVAAPVRCLGIESGAPRHSPSAHQGGQQARITAHKRGLQELLTC